MEGYIDIHNHILPGLDDGPATLQEAVEMARVARKNAITEIIASPHHNECNHPSRNEILAMLELLRSALKKTDMPIIKIYPGNELRISLDLPEKLKAGEVLPLAESSYVLLEFPFEGTPFYAEEIIFRLRVDGWIPILAHPERIYDIQRNPERLGRFIDMGCMAQVNSNSVTGELGRASLETAIKLLKRGWVDIMATDAHAPHNRAPDFTGALKVAAKIVGRQAAQRLVYDNPGNIFTIEKRSSI
ncbi:MAG: tyrosine protein phosphatase [Actinobacteria bacterium]|nr:tyrosine protein phosphatase [Actinomycetota bacterium]